MEIIRKIKDLNIRLSDIDSLGFVPTMGALHEGHLSLIEQSVNQNKYTIASIFVNPTQFNNKEDLEKYPRTLDEDLKLLELAKCDFVYVPDEKEILDKNYTDNFSIDLGDLDKLMEGKYRDNHFNGVALIVNRLFNIIKPQKAYFGIKDFQQLAVINFLNKEFKHNIEINACDIIREEDGLAMSSRNKRINKDDRQYANFIFKTLKKTQQLSKTHTLQESLAIINKQIKENKHFKLEYFEIVDSESLKSINKWDDSDNIRVCIAIYLGNIRLIDNIDVKICK